MKKIFLTLALSGCTLLTLAQSKEPKAPTAPEGKKATVAEAACGACMFGLKDKGCNLAIRLDKKVYLVDGTDIDSHGDAHADDGFCNAIRKAKVEGEVVNNRFKATSFQLLADSTRQSVPAKH